MKLLLWLLGSIRIPRMTFLGLLAFAATGLPFFSPGAEIALVVVGFAFLMAGVFIYVYTPYREAKVSPWGTTPVPGTTSAPGTDSLYGWGAARDLGMLAAVDCRSAYCDPQGG